MRSVYSVLAHPTVTTSNGTPDNNYSGSQCFVCTKQVDYSLYYSFCFETNNSSDIFINLCSTKCMMDAKKFGEVLTKHGIA